MPLAMPRQARRKPKSASSVTVRTETVPLPRSPRSVVSTRKYIVQALEDYKSGARKDPVMAAFAVGLSKQDQEDLAAWYASQTSGGLYTISFTE